MPKPRSPGPWRIEGWEFLPVLSPSFYMIHDTTRTRRAKTYQQYPTIVYKVYSLSKNCKTPQVRGSRTSAKGVGAMALWTTGWTPARTPGRTPPVVVWNMLGPTALRKFQSTDSKKVTFYPLNFSWMPPTHTHTIADNDNGSPLCTVLYRWKSFSTFQRCQSLKQQPILVEGTVAICSNTALECFGTL